MAAPAAMVSPNYAVLFFSYGLGKTAVSKLMPGESTPIKLFMAGSFAGASYAFTICPVERVKCLLQVHTNGNDIQDRLTTDFQPKIV